MCTVSRGLHDRKYILTLDEKKSLLYCFLSKMKEMNLHSCRKYISNWLKEVIIVLSHIEDKGKKFEDLELAFVSILKTE